VGRASLKDNRIRRLNKISAAAQCIRAIGQIIQDVLEITVINTSFAEKQQHHDVYQHEVIHTASKRLQQED
jgi:hypothetical protein